MGNLCPECEFADVTLQVKKLQTVTGARRASCHRLTMKEILVPLTELTVYKEKPVSNEFHSECEVNMRTGMVSSIFSR